MPTVKRRSCQSVSWRRGAVPDPVLSLRWDPVADASPRDRRINHETFRCLDYRFNDGPNRRPNCRQRNFLLPLDTQTASIVGDANNRTTMDSGEYAQLVESRHYAYALEHRAGDLYPYQFDFFVRKDPLAALKFVAHRCSPAQMDFCVKKSPSFAIQYAINLLTKKQRASCLTKDPDAALENLERLEKLGYKLSPEEFDSCVRRSPDGALKFVAKRLNPNQFDFCRRKMPEEALKNKDAAERLSPLQLAICVYRSPPTALKHVADRLSDEQLAFCVEVNLDQTLEYAAARLSAEQLQFCVAENPWKTLLLAVGRISTPQLLDCASRCTVKLNKYLSTHADPSPKLVRALMSVSAQLVPTTEKALTDAVAKRI